jgi:hypothetical protein
MLLWSSAVSGGCIPDSLKRASKAGCCISEDRKIHTLVSLSKREVLLAGSVQCKRCGVSAKATRCAAAMGLQIFVRIITCILITGNYGTGCCAARWGE